MSALPPNLEPWLGWLLVALCRQRTRQTWLVMVKDQRLGDIDDDSGDVPGLTGWRYQFHGMGLCLYGPDHEALDVDFHDAHGRTIDPYFFAHRVRGLAPAPEPEAELRRWLPTADLIVAALDEARARGFIGHPESTHVFTLSDALEAEHEAIAAIDDLRSWRDAWPGTPGEGAHAAWLLGLIAKRPASGVLEAAVHLLPEDVAIDALVALLAGPIDSATGAALEALDGLAHAPTAPVEALLSRFDPSLHHPYAVTAAARFLLGRDAARERALDAVFRFAAVERVKGYRGNPFLSQLAILALEFAPNASIPLVRSALCSNTPCNVGEMAALLASIDRAWCHRELVAALEGDAQTDVSNRRLLVAALARCDSDLARRAAKTHTPAPPIREPGAIGYTWEEVAYANLDSAIEGYVSDVVPVASRLRDVVPG